MELYIYDQSLTLLGVIDELTSLVWTRRYWDCGEFSLLVPMTDRHTQLLQNGRLIIRRDCDEAGQIRYIHISRDSQGLEQIEVQGRFLTHWLGNRLLLAPLVMRAPSDMVLRQAVLETLVSPTDACRRIAVLSIDETPLSDIATLNVSSDDHENALDFCVSRAQLAKIGFKIVTDVRAKRHSFKVYKGLDRTTTQTVNAISVFSPDFDNVLSQEFTRSVENVATAVYVAGEATPDSERAVVEVDDGQTTGMERIEFLYEATGLSRTTMEGGQQVPIPDNEYREMLTARGEQVLDQKIESLSFSSVIDTHANLRYKFDFDVGDRVTCLNRRWHVQIDARITEVVESYERGRESLEVTFGVSLPSLNQALKWR